MLKKQIFVSLISTVFLCFMLFSVSAHAEKILLPNYKLANIYGKSGIELTFENIDVNYNARLWYTDENGLPGQVDDGASVGYENYDFNMKVNTITYEDEELQAIGDGVLHGNYEDLKLPANNEDGTAFVSKPMRVSTSAANELIPSNTGSVSVNSTSIDLDLENEEVEYHDVLLTRKGKEPGANATITGNIDTVSETEGFPLTVGTNEKFPFFLRVQSDTGNVEQVRKVIIELGTQEIYIHDLVFDIMIKDTTPTNDSNDFPPASFGKIQLDEMTTAVFDGRVEIDTLE